MKKLLLPLFLFLIINGPCQAESAQINSTPQGAAITVPLPEVAEKLLNCNMPKYVIMKTTSNYAPVREGADVNAKRFSHLKKGTTLFADSSYKDFFRIDLGLDKHYWIEKKYVEKEAEADVKELPKIDNISYLEDENYYKILIKTPMQTAYNEIETSSNSLDFILYDVILDKDKLKISGSNKADFKISKDKFDNLQISYYSNFPLTGHEVEITKAGLILKVKKPYQVDSKQPLKNLNITLDPGHGGTDSGACANGLKEKDLNLQITKKLETEFKKKGAEVYLTRKEDTNPDLYDRVDYAKDNGSDFLLSIHQNSLANPDMVNKKHGTGVYYYNKEAYLPAKEIQNSLLKETGFRDDGVNIGSFALTRTTNPVCILIECGYIIHKEEAKKLSDDKFQEKVAKAIVHGLETYIKNNFQHKN